MSQFILDSLFTAIFLSLFGLLGRMREKIFSENKSSFNYARAGLATLALVSLVQSAHNQDLFEQIPFLSEPVYLELILVIGMVSGVTLMLAGISIWVPSRKVANAEDISNGSRLTQLKRIADEAENQSEIAMFIRKLPRQLSGQAGFKAAAVIRLNSRCNQIISCDGLDENLKTRCDEMLRESTVIKAETILHKVNPAHAVMLRTGSGIIGALIVWDAEEKRGEQNEGAILELLGRRLASRIEHRRLQLQSQYEQKSLEYLRQMRALVENRTELKNLIRGLYTLFNNAVGAEFFVLSVPDKSPWDLRRYIAGINGNILQSGVTTTVKERDFLAPLIRQRRSLVINDITKISSEQVDILIASCGQKSIMAVPIVSNGRLIGIVTIGHPKPGRFGHKELERCEMLAAAMSPALEEEFLRMVTFDRDRFLNGIGSLCQTQESATDIDSFLAAAAAILSENVRTTMIRVTVLNKERDHLITKAIQTARPFPGIRNGEVALSQELIPWHCLVIRENRPLLINQQDGESRLDTAEAEGLAFGEVQSAIIMPIAVNGLVYGIITMAEMRNWNRSPLDATALTFARAAAAVMAQGIKATQLSRALLLPENERLQGAPPTGKDFYQELKTPLSRIQGSIDLLKIRGFAEAEDSQKILEAMENSTNRLISLINER
ncbi:MAG: GAF domain-containing protein [bacterium]